MPSPSQIVFSLLPFTPFFPSSSPSESGEYFDGHRLAGGRTADGLDSWIQKQQEVAVEKVFANIGNAAGAIPGVVIAIYTWTRDAALFSSGLLSLLPTSPTACPCTASSAPSADALGCSIENRTLSFLEDYVEAQSMLQKVDNPSGTYADLDGLGEPKFDVDLTAFEGEWGRPQRDGPALRARTIMQVRHWNHTSFDLWEEVLSSSFFTTMAQFHALRLGASFFSKDEQSRALYTETAKEVLCFAQEYIVTGDHERNGSWVRSNINVENGVKRSGVDANSVLATLLSSTSLSCASRLHTPCSPTSLSSLSHFLRSFSGIYPINPSPSPFPTLVPLATGRYPEDTYFGGNPWYLTTLAAAEQLYRAIEVWERKGEIEVEVGEKEFWDGIVGREVMEGTYKRGNEDYERMVKEVWKLVDGLLQVLQRYTPADGRMDEQFDKETGDPRSARDLTWSYIAFLTATKARSSALSARKGTSSPTAPFAYLEEPEWSMLECSSGERYNGTMEVWFEVEVRTEWGESILLTGSSPSFGSWSTAPALAIPLSADDYTDEKPIWKTRGGVEVEGRRGVEYKFIKSKQDGTAIWEGGANRIMYTSSAGDRIISTRWKDS
ncbi:hypothetical protein JCM11251_004759 [Rhodosporidiobolus azoricus]